jgi:hypothetical protein
VEWVQVDLGVYSLQAVVGLAPEKEEASTQRKSQGLQSSGSFFLQDIPNG